MNQAFICDAVRTPFGRFGGALSSMRADDLAALPLKALLERNPGLDPALIDDVIYGCANQAGEDNRNVARMALLLAGLPQSVPGSTINRLCGSSLDAIGVAARAIKSGETQLMIAGGVESMSRAPFVMGKAESAFSRSMQMEDTTIGWRFINPQMKALYGVHSMPETAENVADEFAISRADQDAFALRSQLRTAAAQEAGRFADELIAVSVPQRKGEPLRFSRDEHPRSTSLEAQADCGLVPQAAVSPIVNACRHALIDFDALGQAAASAGNLAIPLVKQLTARVKAQDPDAARYVHWGATSQDAIDTGFVLQLRGALAATDSLLQSLIDAFAEQAQRYQHTVMPGRTWMQHALPVTFGLKLAGTLDTLLRWQQRLIEMRPRVLALQFGGAAGTLDSLKQQASQVAQALAQTLDLQLPDTPWHSQRDRFLEVGAWFAGVCGTLGKFANDFSLLMQTEVAEVGEPLAEGRGGSSTMPHKRNPVSCAAILTAAQRTPGLVATLYAGQIQQHERALGGWQAEWETLPELIMLVGGALAQTDMLVREMQVFVHKMRADLDITHGLIMAEAVTLALAEFIGKAEAHHRVEALCRQALDRNGLLVDLLAADPLVSQYLSRERLNALLDPATATGSAERFVRQVLARYQEQHHES
ncbi:TPA: 3-carboxy-cis,cis-muconate cycloisomerase [Klebsiella aerogenes]